MLQCFSKSQNQIAGLAVVSKSLSIPVWKDEPNWLVHRWAEAGAVQEVLDVGCCSTLWWNAELFEKERRQWEKYTVYDVIG